MKKILHFANTDFELQFQTNTIPKYIKKNRAIVLQLYYLSLLYAQENEFSLLPIAPSIQYLHNLEKRLQKKSFFITEKEANFLDISSCCMEPWGEIHPHTPLPFHKKIYENSLPWPLLQTLASKAWLAENFQESSFLIKNQKDLNYYLKNSSYPLICKKEHELAGRGNYILSSFEASQEKKFLQFSNQIFSQKKTMIIQKYYERIMDFSLLYSISQKGRLSFLGASRLINDSQGEYQGSFVGPFEEIFSKNIKYIEQAKLEAQAVCDCLCRLGYRGVFGLDGFVYETRNKEHSQEVFANVELNLRKTMSYVALCLKRSIGKENKSYLFSFEGKRQNKQGLLPETLLDENGKKYSFSRQVYFEENTPID